MIFSGHEKTLASVAVVSVALLAALCAAEAVLDSGHLGTELVPLKEEFDCRALDPLLGGGFKPDCASRWRRLKGDTTVFDAKFSTDSSGRRKVPGAEKLPSEPVAVFFGCSFMLGAGLSDDETLPYYFSRAARMRSLNLAGSGFGPQQMLAQLSEPKLEHRLPLAKSRAVGIYLFLDFQVARASGSPEVAAWYGRHFPRYRFDAQNRLLREGTLADASPVWSMLSGKLEHSALLRLLARAASAAGHSEKDLQLTAAIIAESARLFRDRHGTDEFYVVFHPVSNPKVNQRLARLLAPTGTRVIDYNGLFNQPSIKYIVADGHPSAEAAKTLAVAIARDLKLLKDPF